jgi:hypothetical protein
LPVLLSSVLNAVSPSADVVTPAMVVARPVQKNAAFPEDRPPVDGEAVCSAAAAAARSIDA